MRRDVVAVQWTASAMKTSELWKGAFSSESGFLKRIGAVAVEPYFPTHDRGRTPLSRITRIRLGADGDVNEAISTLSRMPGVEWAVPVVWKRVTYEPNDAQIIKQWYLRTIQAKEAWDIFQGDTSIVIGIVDTGVEWTHPDLSDNIWRNPGEIPDNGIDDEGNGYVDDVRGWNFGEENNDPLPLLSSHGTTVAGVAGAVTDNGVGIAAPAFNVRIMPVKLKVELSGGVVYVSGYSEGVVYAADNGADVINLSFGGGYPSPLESAAVAYARSRGVLVVAAAGNSRGETTSYPSSFPGVLSVAGTNQVDVKASFANWDYTVDVSAPAELMYTTGSGDYTYAWGTSYASPIAASVAALVKGFHPEWGDEEIGMRIGEQVRISADPIDNLNPLFAGKLGSGRVNAFRALTLVSPSVRFSDVQIAEGGGANGNDSFDPGEELLLTFKVKNYLEPVSGIGLDFYVDHPDIILRNTSFSIGSLGTLEEWQNDGNPVRIQISQDTERGQTVDVHMNILADGGYEDVDHTDFSVSKNFATIAGGNTRLTVSARGILGFVDYPMNLEGEGFVFENEANLLFEGAVLAATSSTRVSDAARGNDQSRQNTDWDTAENGEVTVSRPGELADEELVAAFSDQESTDGLDLRVSLRALAFEDAPDDDFILLSYRLDNVSQDSIVGLYFGLFMDWDVGPEHINTVPNVPGYEADLNLAHISDPASNLYAGLQVVSGGGATAYKSVFNPSEIYDDYTDSEKWLHLSGGIQPISQTVPGDYSHVLGVGPLTLEPGDSTAVGFALLAGSGLGGLRTNAIAAVEKWKALFGAAGAAGREDDAMLKPEYRLMVNYPNPFNSGTMIAYRLRTASHVTLTVFDITGREIIRLVEGYQDAGDYEIGWDGNTARGQAPTGVYYYRLDAGDFRKVRKMILIR